MADWKFTDEFGTVYPGLADSVLASLAFSAHTLDSGSGQFTGTINIDSTGIAMETIGVLLGIQTVEVTGTVKAGDNLVIDITTDQTPHKGITDQISAAIPILKENIDSSWLEMQTSVGKGAEDEPQDVYDIIVNLSINGHPVKLDTGIPMNGGFMTITAEPKGVGISLNDLDHLFGGGNSSWQSGYPKQYKEGGAGLFLLNISVSVLINLNPKKIKISSVSGAIGLVGFPVIKDRLYLNPLEVWVSVSGIGSGNTDVNYGLEGSLALPYYDTSTVPRYEDPDFAFDFGMQLKNFSINGKLENPKQESIARMVSDLAGEKVDLEALSEVAITAFDFSASTSADTGKVDNYSFDLDLQGSFGRLKDFSIQEISLSLVHTST